MIHDAPSIARTALRASTRAARCLSLVALGSACATQAGHAPLELAALRGRYEALAAALDATPLPADSAVVMRIAFDAEVDLDLYGTDPTQESVYFGNATSTSGGRLLSDRRCGDAAPRVEIATWPRAQPGPWRLGIDHPERCDDATDSAPFVAELIAPGLRKRITGTIAPRHFELRVIEETLQRWQGDVGWSQRP